VDSGTDRQGAEAARYAQAWFVFVGPDGELSTDRKAPHISIGATHGGRVRVIVPEGLGDIAPEVAEHVADRIDQAAGIASDLSGAPQCPAGRLIEDDDIMFCRRRAGHADPHRDVAGNEWGHDPANPKHLADVDAYDPEARGAVD
jgi:hypothetical protein